MEKNYKSFIISKILVEAGIVIAPVHSAGLFAYIDKLLEIKNINIEEYCYQLNTDEKVLNDLINHATTNETYFFREEKQFDYLAQVVFPKYRNRKLVIWSGACSSGEEPLSLLALAMEFNINVEIYASDIDDNVLSFFKKGEYSKYSFRPDGEKYHKYLNKIGDFNEDKSKFILHRDVFDKIKILKYNLTYFNEFPIDKKIDIIFMRNVFIYFDTDTRSKITLEVTKRLNEGGHLFYSINEIGSMNKNVVPDYMKKQNYQQIYFYVKKFQNEDEKLAVDSIKSSCIKPSDIFQDLSKSISKKDYNQAFKIAEDYKPAFSDSFYSSFFKGYVLMKEEKYSEADKYFSTSEFMKSEFWPVYFFHGLLLEKLSNKDKAVICFRKCYEKIKKYEDKSSNEFDFILKDLSPSYICTYCSKFLGNI